MGVVVLLTRWLCEMGGFILCAWLYWYNYCVRWVVLFGGHGCTVNRVAV